METILVQDVVNWLYSLCEDRYPEDGLIEGQADRPVQGILVCWSCSPEARADALCRRANLIVGHEGLYYGSPQRDPGCPPSETWEANRQIRAFFQSHGFAFVRSHRTLDAYCIAAAFCDFLELPPAVILEGYHGYVFTRVHEIAPRPLRVLAQQLKVRMGCPAVRISADHADRVVRRLGIGWGGSSNSRNLQYMERLVQHRVDAIIGGEVDEIAMEYYRESDVAWVELGHGATETIGLRRAAEELAGAFPGLPVTCHAAPGRWTLA